MKKIKSKKLLSPRPFVEVNEMGPVDIEEDDEEDEEEEEEEI